MKCNMRVLTVLMWKHAVVRARRFIHTAVDLASPLMFFILLFVLKSYINMNPENSRRVKDPVANTDIIPLSELMPGPYYVLYTPDTPLTNSLMDDVGPKLNLQRLDSFPDRTKKGYFAYKNESELEPFIRNMGISDAIIIFQKMSGETWPERLNYTIRLKHEFLTGTYSSLDDSPGPHRNFGFKYGMFMRIQWAIDTSYIKLLTGSEITQNLSIQEFPYYERSVNTDVAIVCILLQVLCWLSLMLTFVFLMCRLLEERSSGIQELMKMVGVSLNTLGVTHFLNILPCGLVFAIVGSVLLKVTAQPLIPHTNGFLIFLMLLLYFNSVVALAFACSYISKGTHYAATLSVLAYILLWIPTRVASEHNISPALTLLTGFFPHAPMYWFWDEVANIEMFGAGITFKNIATRHDKVSVAISFFFLILQSALYYVFAWYLSLVRPGRYGQALPWNFPFKASYWRNKNEVRPDGDDEEEDPIAHDPRYFETAPSHMDVGIKIVNVSKVFAKQVALRNVSLEVYKGEITVLLGHNGAGKTTLMSIITGMTSATEGKVYVNGKDTVTQRDEVRQNIGLCPQHNLFFPNLTVQQHIMFFTLLKRGSYKQALESSVTLATRLGLRDKLHAQAHELSGGMKRRAQLACALAGGASVLVLDEPTSGLDVETRRELWDLLLVSYISNCRAACALAGGASVLVLDEPTSGLDVETRRELWDLLLVSYISNCRAACALAGGASVLVLDEPTSGLDVETRRELWDLLLVSYISNCRAACALAGGASVLVLDEPTSGLDVETRRELWDLLLALRGERTVLLTTHFMEEADALGDRVAALHLGKLRCFASSMHLKKAVGTGYRLSFTTIGTPKDQAITKVVTSHVHDATLKEKTINSLSYNLPAAASAKFPALFTALESKRSELGIDSIGVGVSTLEEVFLKLCSDVDTSISEDEVDNVHEPERTPIRITGIPLYLRQLYVLLKRQVKFALYKKWNFLILQVILPIIMIMVLTDLFNNKLSQPTRELDMNLDIYADRPERRILYRSDLPDISTDAIERSYKKIKFEKVANVADAALRTAEQDILEYNKYLVGFEVNETDAKILYTTTIRHAAPVALNLLSNILATRYMSWADGHSLTARNDPVRRQEAPAPTVPHAPKDMVTAVTWCVCITFILLATNINCVALPCKERQTGSRHIHVMSGCPAELHWMATLTWHMCVCGVALVLPTVIAAVLFEQDNTINQPDFIGTFALVMLLGSMSFFALMYLVSFNFGERSTSIILVALIIVCGIVTPFMKAGQELFEENYRGFTYYLLTVMGYIAAPHTLTTAALHCVNVARLNAWCPLVRDKCPAPFVKEMGFDVAKCCAGEKPRCYLCIDDYSPGEEIIILFVQFTITMAMVILTQRGIFNGVRDKLVNARYVPPPVPQEDEMVRAEKAYVSKAITLPTKQIPDAMLVNDLHKNYVGFLKKCNAVKGVSFSVKKGECFGLLGVNGAGKSTTFKMLTAEICPTRGNIFGNGYHLKRGNSQYLQTLGYCPQFFGLDMFQTGEDNLRLMLTLRGFDKQLVEEEVKTWIHIVGLEKYAKRRVTSYSGGCVRRLGAAAALCTRSSLALLDEPSAGVDVAARRRLWAAIRRALHHKRALIITSHSMDEMEALCNRIAIMSAGTVRAIGTPTGLRAAHAQGHAVVFKLKHQEAQDEVDGAKTHVGRLKGKLHDKFNCTLKDEHKTMLHYHINETMRYSDLFAQLEAMRAEFPSLIEDYSVTETTLEEVFLSFAKEQGAHDTV
ncbi:phospholipid-transporting ATPase ABCA3 [Helicoverpa armigera]|uniref:phospholipid-transporting ATPase ABCA3 n=1 Tax=Helicoverpa armigera TaxID=29058 RepID=UPI0030832CA2